MKLQVTQENLAKALNNVARIAISSRNPLPILSNILLKTVNNRLSISATNLEIAITEKIGSKIQTNGAVTVPARLMQEYVNSLPSGVLDLELEEHKLHISTEQYRSTINGIIADEYPVVPEIDKGVNWTLPAKECRDLAKVVFAASSDETRPVLTGVLLQSQKGFLYAASTDSYRLAEKKLIKTSKEVSLLIPALAIQELLRILPEDVEEIEVISDNQQVLFRAGELELVSRLIDSTYPDYRKLIPTNFATTATLDRNEFIAITKVSSLFARESAGSITIKVDESNKQISITSIASQLGENTSSAPAVIQGSGEVTLNSRYLLDVLNILNGKDVTFSFNGKLDPCVLTDSESNDSTYLVMPLKS